ncbi:hypothetical protein RJT34_09027 [Clitoria ternatea]|uniref:Uncharacterized protein n=1 Tax=Clitoria ternatea TaxID=43366 RepID=A0AAN9K721_CLITE
MGGQQKKLGQRGRNEIMGFTVPHKSSGFDLMQNCDLPPPSKVFMGSDKSVMLSMKRVYNIAAGKEEEQDSKNYGTYRIENGDDETDKMELLKALQASQTRARVAEKKAALLRKEKEGLSMALLEEAMHLFAYRQQVRLLELQVLNLHKSLWLQKQPEETVVGSSKGNDHDEETSVTWVLALVLSLGIGVTTALACTYYL